MEKYYFCPYCGDAIEEVKYLVFFCWKCQKEIDIDEIATSIWWE